MGKKAPAVYVASAVLVVLASALGTSSESVAAGQETVVIPDEVSCPECEIVLEHVVSLGADHRAPLICKPEAHVAVDSRGRYFVAPTCTPGQVSVFDPNGALRTAFSSQPGASAPAANLRMWVTPEDDVHIQTVTARHIVFDAQQQLISHWRPRPLPHDLVGLPGRFTVQSFPGRTRRQTGFPLHILDGEGRVVGSFGAITRSYREDRQELLRRVLARDHDGESVWAAHSEAYRLERWDFKGRLQRVLVRLVEWEESSGAWIRDIYKEEGGPLWVTINKPLDNWFPSHGGGPDGHFETTIEAIDSIKGELIASTRTEVTFARWIGPNLTFSYTVTDEGRVLIEVWRVRVDRSS